MDVLLSLFMEGSKRAVDSLQQIRKFAKQTDKVRVKNPYVFHNILCTGLKEIFKPDLNFCFIQPVVEIDINLKIISQLIFTFV